MVHCVTFIPFSVLVPFRGQTLKGTKIRDAILAALKIMEATTQKNAPTHTQLFDRVVDDLKEGGLVETRPSKRDFQRALDELVELGLVDRIQDPKDRRKTRILLKELPRPASPPMEAGHFSIWLSALFDFVLFRLAHDLANSTRMRSREEAEAKMRQMLESYYIPFLVAAARRCQKERDRGRKAIIRYVEELAKQGKLLESESVIQSIKTDDRDTVKLR